MDAPSYTQLAEDAGISRSYAHEIAKGARVPARPLAIHIMRQTGWRHPSIADLTDEQIELLETLDPYSTRPEQTPPSEAVAS